MDEPTPGWRVANHNERGQRSTDVVTSEVRDWADGVGHEGWTGRLRSKLTKRWWIVESRWDWRGMRLCAEGIADCEGGGLCQRYGWTGRWTARVAHKRAGHRLRLQCDLERFPTLLRPLGSLRAPVEGCSVETQRDASGAHPAAASRIQMPSSSTLARGPSALV